MQADMRARDIERAVLFDPLVPGKGFSAVHDDAEPARRDSGISPQIVGVLVMGAREAEDREAAPTAVVADSQSVKTTEAGAARVRRGEEKQGSQAARRRR
jgi:hypothetical protein